MLLPPRRQITDFPTVKLALILGLGEWEQSKWRRQQRLYKIVVILGMLTLGFRRILQLPTLCTKKWNDWLFEPAGQLIFVNALFYFSGAVAAILLHVFHKNDVILKQDIESRVDKESYRKCFYLMIGCTAYGLLVGVSGLCAFYLHGLGEIPSLFGKCLGWIVLEFYCNFLCQNSLNLMAASIYQALSVLKRKIEDLEVVMGSRPVKNNLEEYMNKLKTVQHLHFEVVNTKEILQRQYGFPTLYAYAVSIPCLCFLVYLLLKNINEAIPLVLSICLWFFSNLGALTAISFVAFDIDQGGERLVASSIRMSNNILGKHSNLALLSYSNLLHSQIQSSRLTFNACGYFELKKNILITLFSTILTNFLILVQFSKDDWY